jgi:hypothetical protein
MAAGPASGFVTESEGLAGDPSATRASPLREMFKGFGFARHNTPPSRPGRPIESAESRERTTIAPEEDDIGEIPAFLRKEREHA